MTNCSRGAKYLELGGENVTKGDLAGHGKKWK